MINSTLIFEHFALVDGELFKRLGDGTLRLVSAIGSGRLISRVFGRAYYGPDIAWTILHGSAPIFPIQQLDGDPTNLDVDNLMPVRTVRVRFRPKSSAQGFSHCLDRTAFFKTLHECKDHWCLKARQHYFPDVALVLEMAKTQESLRTASTGVQTAPRPIRTRKYQAKGKQPLRPSAVAGKCWYLYEGSWILTWPAQHPSDDYKARCAAVLAGATQATFDPVSQTTKYT